MEFPIKIFRAHGAQPTLLKQSDGGLGPEVIAPDRRELYLSCGSGTAEAMPWHEQDPPKSCKVNLRLS